jgi:hypothetical protein
VKKLLAKIAHDFVAHPLMGITNHAAWAERFHDFVASAISGYEKVGIQIRGDIATLRAAVATLEQNGYHAGGFHDDGNGWGIVDLQRQHDQRP